MAVSNLVVASTTSVPTLQRTLTSGSSVSDLPTGKEITAFIIGAGGGGGLNGSPGATTNGGAAGGGSGSIVQHIFTLPSSKTITYSIGAGGSGATTGSRGGTGGSTTFDGVSAHGGYGAGNSQGEWGGFGGGGGGAGGGNSNNTGATGGTYGNHGNSNYRYVYGQKAGWGRKLDLIDVKGPFWAGMSQSSQGTTYQFDYWPGIMPQFDDVIHLGYRMSNSTSFIVTTTNYGSDFTSHFKMRPWNNHPINSGTDITISSFNSNSFFDGGGTQLTGGYYQYFINPKTYLSRLDWLINAGINLPAGGSGGGGGGAAGGASVSSGGAGGQYNVSNPTAGSVPGGGGGGGGGANINATPTQNGASGGAGAIYLFWAS